jgi:putative ABC transport system permease protein
MLEFLYRKIINNKWLFFCLLIGALSACGILSSIPLYSKAILQKVLTSDLENYHVEKIVSPGTYRVDMAGSGFFNKETADRIKETIHNQLFTGFDLPVEGILTQTQLNALIINRDEDHYFNEQRIRGYPVYISGYEQNIELLHGRLPEKYPVGDVFEVAVSLEGINEMQLLQNEVYTFVWTDFFNDEKIEIAKFKVVGVFTVKDTNSLYWSGGRYRNLKESLLLSGEQIDLLMERSEKVTIKSMENVCFYDYRAVNIDDVDKIIEISENQYRWNEKNGNSVRIYFPLITVLENYKGRQLQLKITLWILTIPMMLIICFYTMMISGLVVRNSGNEIAILKSRGAGRLQVFLLYLMESIILATISFFAGPFTGYYICRFLGSSNGFLEFVGRKALEPVITRETYAYSMAAGIIFMLFMLIPVVKASTTGIVEYKRSLTGDSGKPFWQKFYLDILVLTLCGYGYYQFKMRRDILGLSGLSGTDLSVDPLLFFISTFFILGISLMFLRLYPLLIRLIFRLGSRWWNPVAYFSLINVSRADRNQQSIMLFIILSLSFGIMNANQARTINSNVIDKVMYNNGADVVIEPYNNLNKSVDFIPAIPVDDIESDIGPKVYIEPPYDQYLKINGYESITRVLVDKLATLTSGRERIRNIKVMGITPHEFGKTAWFRNDLLKPYHLNNYLNILTKAPKAVLLSSSIRDEFRIREGDTVSITLRNGGTLDFTVYGFIDYFPDCNIYSDEATMNKNHFAVINHSYVMKKLPPVPYEIWLKKKPGVTDGEINDQITSLNLRVDRVDYASQEIIKKKNDPILLGTNGVLTMCFIVTMGIAAIGFVIFWILSIREKSLKFGIFRAMGMPMRSITLIMLTEQFLVSVVSIIIGVVLGSIASLIFIPLLEMVYSAYQQVPPFKITAEYTDYIKVLGITGAMLVTGLAILYFLVRRINVHQVIKMGEDS